MRARRFRTHWRRALTGHARLGFCPVCSRRTVFVAVTDWLRDSYECFRCGSIPRQRALMTVLEQVAPDWRERRIHESSPDGASSDRIARQCANYDASQFWPDVPPGSYREGVRCEDLTRLTFGDTSLDLLITQDVFEHVLEPERGFAEIARVLRPGGLHVFTVPWYSWQPTVTRVRAVPDGIEHLLEPEYHANPVDPQGSLVVTNWGRELLDVIRASSGMETAVHSLHDPRRGIVGAFADVFVSRRGA